jgi:hypothetical protein
MAEQESAKEKVEAFLDKLTAFGYKVEWQSDRPQVYRIDGKRVNVRSTVNIREEAHGVITIWYDVSEGVLSEVDYVAYITTTPDYFVLIPSDFLAGVYDEMYHANGKAGTRSFILNWDRCTMEVRDRAVDLMPYYHNLLLEDGLPKF